MKNWILSYPFYLSMLLTLTALQSPAVDLGIKQAKSETSAARSKNLDLSRPAQTDLSLKQSSKLELSVERRSQKDSAPTRSEGMERQKANMASEGGGGTGGGAVYQDQGEFKTLAELGIIYERIAFEAKKIEAPSIYTVSESVKKELRSILSELPVLYPDLLFDKILPLQFHRDIFVDLENINPTEYAKIQSDYALVMKGYEHDLDESRYVLTAFSKDGKTFILPSFKDQRLSDHRRALILIHEFFIRTAPSDVPGSADLLKRRTITEILDQVFQLDAQIHKRLSGDKSPELAFRILDSMFLLGEMRVKDMLVAYNGLHFQTFRQLSAQMGRSVWMSDLVLDVIESRRSGVPVNLSLMKTLENILPGSTRYLVNSFVFDVESPSYPESSQKKYAHIYNPDFLTFMPAAQAASVSSKLKNTFDQLCAQNRKAMDEFGMSDNTIIYPDSLTSSIYSINCGNPKLSVGTAIFIIPKKYIGIY